ncbi:hypothetical protein Ae201684_003274 [Aphanomyces euteiches]|uniref:Uncharacterized protein n=1 Tax=Aphanomyces euteiches TaxID=100861 RepID=A0A6G0XMH6_9STRA|nr:hypothetical protein Ae201684_003274 [Aphanomyces euteiches]
MSVGPSSTAVTQAHSTDNHGSVGRGESSSLVETTSILQTLTRVLANVLAGSLVLLPVITLAVLIFQGMFKRLIMSENAQTTDFYWAEYSQSCVLRSSGWVDKTCEAKVSSIAPAPAFASIGRVLAQHWANGTAHAGGSLKISTCTIGGTDQVGWTNIIFIAGLVLSLRFGFDLELATIISQNVCQRRRKTWRAWPWLRPP